MSLHDAGNSPDPCLAERIAAQYLAEQDIQRSCEWLELAAAREFAATGGVACVEFMGRQHREARR